MYIYGILNSFGICTHQFTLLPLTCAYFTDNFTPHTVTRSLATAENGKIKNSEVKANEKSSLLGYQVR